MKIARMRVRIDEFLSTPARHMLPFFIECRSFQIRLFELANGRFQLLEAGEVAPFLPGYGYLLVERRLAEFLIERAVERIHCERVVLFDRTSGKEFRTHVKIRVQQYFRPDQIHDLDLVGLRLLTMNDVNYFASPELKDLLQKSGFDYLSFSEGLGRFAETDT